MFIEWRELQENLRTYLLNGTHDEVTGGTYREKGSVSIAA
jgi:hypothetical protein